MVNMESAAPGKLESIRVLLNTWRISNETRQPVDDLADLLTDRDAWTARIPDLRYPNDDASRRALEGFRRKLRAGLRHDSADSLDELVSAHRWQPSIDTKSFTVRWYTDPASTVGDGLAIVLDAVVARTWTRLRACPDCQWVFYDTSRNGRRTWCSMTATDGARGCGSIAKTRAYRQRQRANAPDASPPVEQPRR
jgi:hypothetical protein